MAIKNWDEFYELEALVREADERLKLGTGASGLHFQLNNLLRKLGAYGHTREQTINVGKRLLREWEEAQSTPKSQQEQDGEFIDKHNDME
jgi:hypothetical protein